MAIGRCGGHGDGGDSPLRWDFCLNNDGQPAAPASGLTRGQPRGELSRWDREATHFIIYRSVSSISDKQWWPQATQKGNILCKKEKGVTSILGHS